MHWTGASWLFLFAFLALLAATSGCSSTEDIDNSSARPWNAPKSWETGLPAGMTDRQR